MIPVAGLKWCGICPDGALPALPQPLGSADAASTRALIPARTAAGRLAQAATTLAKSGSVGCLFASVWASGAPDSAPPAPEIPDFPKESGGCSNPLGVTTPCTLASAGCTGLFFLLVLPLPLDRLSRWRFRGSNPADLPKCHTVTASLI